jgi:hypothetical protein
LVFEDVELPLLDHVHRLDSRDQSARAVEVPEPEHGSHDAFDCAVILLDDVVEILALPHLDIGTRVSQHTHDGRGVGAILVDGCLVGHAVQIDRPFEEAPRSGAVAVRAQQECVGPSDKRWAIVSATAAPYDRLRIFDLADRGSDFP